MFEIIDEDLDGDGVMDLGEDMDGDGVFDCFNFFLLNGNMWDDLFMFYEWEINIFVLCLVIFMWVGEEYVVVLINCLCGEDGYVVWFLFFGVTLVI